MQKDKDVFRVKWDF